MKIKKIYIAGVIVFICLVTGYILVNIFLKTLINSGFYGLIILIVFIVSLLWSINYWWGMKIKEDAAEEAARDIANRNKYGYISKDQLKESIKTTLLKNIKNEYYNFNKH